MADTQLQAVLNVYTPSAPGATADGDIVQITAQDGGTTSGNGGNVTIGAGSGDGDGSGGTLSLAAGNAAGEGNAGGDINIEAGSGSGALGDGGETFIRAGDADGDGNAGNVVLMPGEANGAGIAGHIRLIGLEDFADDAAAATGGVPVTGLYRTASAIKVRVA